MRLLIDDAAPRVRFTIVLGVGSAGESFGNSVMSRLQEFLHILPEGMRCALRLGPPTDPSELGSRLRELRRMLVTLETIQEIERCGLRVEGGESERYPVQFILVSEKGELNPATYSAIEDFQREYPSDRYNLFLLVVSADDAVETIRGFPFAATSYLVSPSLASGLEVRADHLVTETAGTILLLLHPLSGTRLESRGASEILFPGFSGFYGLDGLARRRVARMTASSLIGAHLREEKDRPPEGPYSGLLNFLERFSPKHLGLSLFDPRNVKMVTIRNIPFRPDWRGDTLVVAGNVGDPSLKLKSVPEPLWSDEIRKYSRAFDMTIGARLNRQLQSAASTTKKEVKGEFPDRFSRILNSLTRSPCHLERVLNTLEERSQEERTHQPPPTEDLEKALAKLDDAVASRPNGILLAVKLALWLIPALLVGTLLLFSLYPTARAAILSAVTVSTGLMAGAGYVILKLDRADKIVTRAKDRAIRIMLERQESIISANAVGYLHEIISVLGNCIRNARSELNRCKDMLLKGRETLDAKTGTDLADHPPFSPVITKAPQYQRLLERLEIDTEQWLEEALSQGLLHASLGEGKEEGEWTEGLVSWCDERLRSGIGIRNITFKDLLGIRVEEERPAGTDFLEKILDDLARWAEPLTALSTGSEIRLLVVPQDLGPDVQGIMESGTGKRLGKYELIEEGSFPLFCCARVRRYEEP